MLRTRALGRPAIFNVAALLIVAACAAILRSHAFRANPSVVAWGVTFDLTITIPAVYWLTIVRSGRARPLTIAPVFVVCAALAAMLLPRDQQTFLHQLRLIAAPLDIVTLGLVVRKLLEVKRRRNSSADAEERIGSAARAIFGDGVVAAAVAAEISVMYYAFFCWRREPVIPEDARPITVHERSGWGSIVVCIIVLVAAESLGMHLLLQLWSVRAAWIMTALDAYGILWLIGDYHALRLRPTLVREESIEIRHGLRWGVTIDRANVAAVDPVKREEEWKRRGTLKLALFDEPQFIVRLHDPVVAHGIAGLRKTIDSVAFRPDDADALLSLRAVDR